MIIPLPWEIQSKKGSLENCSLILVLSFTYATAILFEGFGGLARRGHPKASKCNNCLKQSYFKNVSPSRMASVLVNSWRDETINGGTSFLDLAENLAHDSMGWVGWGGGCGLKKNVSWSNERGDLNDTMEVFGT